MPEPVAVTSQPKEIEIAKELLGKRILLTVDKKDPAVTVYDNLQCEHVVAVVHPGSTHAIITENKLVCASKADSKLTRSPA